MRPCLEDVLFNLEPAKRVWKPLLKRLLTGAWRPLLMRPAEADFSGEWKRLGLYLHVPFCRNLCPFCPYNRVEFEPGLYAGFERAVHQEIDIVAQRVRGKSFKLGSLYVGGGTPTLDPQSLLRMLSHLRRAFGPAEDVCVELHPAAMDDACLDLLKEAGVGMLSIGVESLNDRLLKLIGRSHDAAQAEDALRRAVSKGFNSVNADLMFALPTQTLSELDRDLGRVLDLGADQVSTYPIFGFPYSDLGRQLGLRAVRRPNGTLIRAMLDIIRRRCVERGLERCAVWSFLRPGRKKFSSVTRHHYLGFGPSAASMTGGQFRVNTFSVAEYAGALPRRLPVALALPLDKRLEAVYWLYWRAYEMEIPAQGYRELFGGGLEEAFGPVLGALRLAGMIEEDDGCRRVTEKAAYWIHRLQNEYSLNYIDRLWGSCRGEPWPGEVRL
ncbi:MAG: radical SAM protein [candidate division NC10 bacterium]